MKFETTPPASADDPGADAGSSFQISARPVVAGVTAEPDEADAPQLPRSYGTESLSLLARDPRTIFAFWDIDWNKAFRGLAPKARKVHLRLLTANGAEESVIEVEPMAGSCYLPVANADSAYRGEIGYFHPPAQWNPLAASELITTPTDIISTATEIDFATVPFHLSFQRMVDLLEATQEENATLTTMLSGLRARVASAETNPAVTPEQRELARAVEHIAAMAPAADTSADPRLQRKLERIIGFNPTSPSGGFGGSSRTR
ncbi:MAG: DUF4912 domain-containing protein [Chthoniobacterales bacterium]